MTSLSYPLMIILSMRKVKTFLDTFLNSLIPHHPYYYTLLHKKFAHSLLYFFTFVAVSYLCFLTIFSLRYHPYSTTYATLNNFIESVETFPSNLMITVNKGIVHTNYGRPYFMWMNQDNKKILLFVVDEHATEKEVSQYRAISLVGHDAVYIKNVDTNTYDKHSLDTLTTRVDRESIANYSQVFRNINATFSILFPVVTIFVVPVLIAFIGFVSIALIAVAVHLFGRSFTKRKLSYKKAVQIGLHAMTLPTIIIYTLAFINPRFPTFQLYALLITIFTVFAVHETYWESSHHPAHHHN